MRSLYKEWNICEFPFDCNIPNFDCKFGVGSNYTELMIKSFTEFDCDIEMYDRDAQSLKFFKSYHQIDLGGDKVYIFKKEDLSNIFLIFTDLEFGIIFTNKKIRDHCLDLFRAANRDFLEQFNFIKNNFSDYHDLEFINGVISIVD